jgi:hypothetical protein
LTIDDSKFIHIVGMYKSGTSWLSHVLSAHPEIIGWREFDIVRAARKESASSMFWRVANRYKALRHLPPANIQEINFLLKDKDSIIRDMFCGTGWVPLRGENLRQEAQALDRSDSSLFIDQMMQLADKKLPPDNRPLLKAGRFNNTLGFGNNTKKDLVQLLDVIKSSDDLSQVPNRFLEHLQRQCEPGVRIALKAADQVLCLTQLQEISPLSRKIAIIRDGRDAAISAGHFGKLMRKRDTPWIPHKRSFLAELRSWAQRIRILSDHAEEHGVIILRYEDLKRDFFGLSSALFNALDVSVSQQLLTEIHQKTDFSTVSGGRVPGQSAEDIFRKGVTGEWKSVLSKKEADLAWRIAGPALERFGYTESGEYIDDLGGLILKGSIG